jgi:hypothetical protein
MSVYFIRKVSVRSTNHCPGNDKQTFSSSHRFQAYFGNLRPYNTRVILCFERPWGSLLGRRGDWIPKAPEALFGCRFVLTWLTAADKTRALNDRR